MCAGEGIRYRLGEGGVYKGLGECIEYRFRADFLVSGGSRAPVGPAVYMRTESSLFSS